MSFTSVCLFRAWTSDGGALGKGAKSVVGGSRQVKIPLELSRTSLLSSISRITSDIRSSRISRNRIWGSISFTALSDNCREREPAWSCLSADAADRHFRLWGLRAHRRLWLRRGVHDRPLCRHGLWRPEALSLRRDADRAARGGGESCLIGMWSRRWASHWTSWWSRAAAEPGLFWTKRQIPKASRLCSIGCVGWTTRWSS